MCSSLLPSCCPAVFVPLHFTTLSLFIGSVVLCRYDNFDYRKPATDDQVAEYQRRLDAEAEDVEGDEDNDEDREGPPQVVVLPARCPFTNGDQLRRFQADIKPLRKEDKDVNNLFTNRIEAALTAVDRIISEG